MNSSMQKKNGTHLHSLMLAECLWIPNCMWAQWCSGWCISAVATVTVGHLCWCRLLCVANWLLFITGKNVQLIVITMLRKKKHFVAVDLLCEIVLFISVLVSLEINRKDYFWSNLCICLSTYLDAYTDMNTKVYTSWKKMYSGHTVENFFCLLKTRFFHL